MYPTATYAETFPGGLGTGAIAVLADDVWYSVEVLVTRTEVAFIIAGPDGAIAEAAWRDGASIDGAGYGFAVLCAHSENASCEYPEGSSFARQPFEVRFSDISVIWSIGHEEAALPRFEKRRPRPPAFGAAFAR